MNFLKKILILLLLVMGLSRCSTDFSVTAEYKEFTVIWALLNHTDQVHYIRIQKAYLDESTSALLIATNPDSIYYPNTLVAKVIEKGTTLVFPLEKIDGDTLNPPIKKDSGTFASSPNILYRFKGQLDQFKTYRIEILNGENGHTASAETVLVNDFSINRPFDEQKINWVGPSNFFCFWQLAQNGKIHDLNMRIHYHTANVNSPNVTTGYKYIDWQVFKNKDFIGNPVKYDIPGETFYKAVQRLLDPDPEIIRYFDSLNFTFSVGNVMLSDYVNFNQAQTSITQNQTIILFTNVENGVGLFASRFYKTVTGVFMNDPSIDSLACGSITGDLGFAPNKSFPKYPFCD
jgi:hypothetical protein